MKFDNRILAIIFAWLITFPEIFIRLVFSVTIIPISQSLHVNYFYASILLSSFYMGYALFNLPMGYLVDKYGYVIISISLIMLSLFTLIFSFSSDYYISLITMFLIGVFSAPTYIGSVKLVSERNPGYRATAISLLNTAGPFSLLITNILFPSYLETLNWRIIYVYIAIFAILVSIPVFFIKKIVERPEKSAINRKSIMAAFIRFSGFWGMWGISTYLFLLSSIEFHLSYAYSGLVSAVFSLGALTSIPISGFISDIIKKRKEVSTAYLFLFFILLIVFPFISSDILLFMSFILGFISFGYRTPLDAYISEIIKGKEATSMGLANLVSQPSLIIVPAVVGAIITFTNNVYLAFLTLSLGPLVAIILLQILD
ncbi:MAG: MFS transporter [Thermoplasmata archaeon]